MKQTESSRPGALSGQHLIRHPAPLRRGIPPSPQGEGFGRVGAAIRDLLWPRRCILCRRFLGADGGRLCPACAASLPEPVSGARRGSHYRRWAAALWYEDAFRASFRRYKFEGCSFYADVYGSWLANAIQKQLGTDYELVTYIPISSLRRRKRGYDQTLLLAQSAGKLLGLEPICTLRKKNLVRAQSRLIGSEARQRNIRGAFRVLDPALVRGKTILLIDDVLTTGATVSEAARVLLEAGAKRVDVATLAAAAN